MARWVTSSSNWTPTAVADTVAFTANGFHAIQGASSTQRIAIVEINMSGMASSATQNAMVVARDSTFTAATPSGGKNAALDPATAALTNPVVGFTTSSGTIGQRSSTLYLLTIGFQAFGGVFRWVAAQGYEIGMLGNTASFGETSITSVTGVGPLSSNIYFEPF